MREYVQEEDAGAATDGGTANPEAGSDVEALNKSIPKEIQEVISNMYKICALVWRLYRLVTKQEPAPRKKGGKLWRMAMRLLPKGRDSENAGRKQGADKGARAKPKKYPSVSSMSRPASPSVYDGFEMGV